METIWLIKAVLICLFSYFMGSIPFGVIVSKYGHKDRVDIQKVGSGNIGATNVGRKLGFKYGALVAGLDTWKGALPVILTIYYFREPLWLAGIAWLCVFLGHLFPVWLKFKGGKGVSVFVGGLLGLVGWQTILIIFFCWFVILIFFARRKMSIANLTLTACLLFFVLSIPILIYVGLMLTIIILLVWWAHRENIQRFLNGKEPSVKLPSFFNKLPDDLIGLVIGKLELLINKLQLLINRLRNSQKKP